MRIIRSEFVCSAVYPEQYPQPDLPEIALIGRSNVGKSSLINSLCGRRGLARISANPGKTQTLNFYLINQSFYFVDLPGYGYAKASKSARRMWSTFIENYLQKSQRLLQVLQLVDFRHPPMDSDIGCYDWLVKHELPVTVVATKVDKLGKSQYSARQRQIRQDMGLRAQDDMILYSSQTGMGKENLLDALNILLTGEQPAETL